MSFELYLNQECMDSQTAQELIQQVKLGNQAAYAELVKRFQKKIFYLAYRMTRDFDSADDIAQETFIKAYQNIHTFKEGYTFYTWLYRICMNLAINYLRRQKLFVREQHLDNFEQLVGSQPDESESVLEREELLENLKRELLNLPVDFRAVLVLKFYENLSCAEIAGVLKIPLGTVLSRLARAREELAGRMKTLKR